MRVNTPERTLRRGGRTWRTVVASLALLAGALVVAEAPATAAQAPGNDVVGWTNGWSWTYQTTFKYVDEESGTDATINENVTYSVAGSTTFGGQDAYQLNINGSITGGSGKAVIEGTGTVNLSSFSGSVSGTRIVRKSDLALLQENQHQTAHATAKYSIFSIGVDAVIDLSLTPTPGWRTRDFPLNAGDSWTNANQGITYTGGFSYTSSLANGDQPFDGSFDFGGTSTVTNETVSVPAGSLATNKVHAQANTDDGVAVDDIWWSAARMNDAKEHMQLPLDGGSLTIDRNLSSSSTPAPGTPLTLLASPSLSCAGGPVAISGKLGNTAGVPVSIYLDKSPVNPSQRIAANTTTGANGNFSTTVTAPVESDGLSKNGARGSWGVVATGGGTTAATTVVVTPKDCTTLEYTGVVTAPRSSNAAVSAKLTNLADGSASGRTITFSLDGGASVNGVTNASGVATAALPTGATARSTSVRASYAGNATTEAAEATAAFTVGKVDTVTSVSPSLPSVETNEPVTFTADVTPGQSGVGDADGTVQFKIDGNNFGAAVPVSGGSATSAAFSTGDTGQHTVQAVYSGSAGFSASSSATTIFEVTTPRAPTSTTASASPATSVFGQTVTLSATVTPNGGGDTPTGSVTFKRGATTVGTANLDAAGHATLDTGALPVGSGSITAVYGGDETYKSSTSAPQNVVVNKAATAVTLQSSSASTVTGESVDFTATVGAVAPGAGTPTGTVQLQVDGANVGSPVALSGGVATFDPVTSLGAGAHTVKAVYGGSASFLGSDDSITQDVAKASTSTAVITSPSVSNEGSNVTVTAAVTAVTPGSGTPTGTVSFTADGASIGAAAIDNDGRASIQIDSLAPGDHLIKATYAGSADYTGSASDEVTHSVVEGAAIVGTTVDLSSTENPTTYGTLIRFTAHVSAVDGSAPTGKVQFSVDGTNIGGPVTINGSGDAQSVQLNAPEPGDHTVIATFLPDAGYSGNGAIFTQTVTDADVALTLDSSDASSDYGQAVHFTANVASAQAGTASPTGYVQFSVDGTALGDAVELNGSGTAVSPTVNDLVPGDHVVTALYSGDAHFLSASTQLTQQVAKVATTTALAVSPASTTYGDPLTLTATVTPAQSGVGAPVGSVEFLDGTTSLGTVGLDANGKATLTRSDINAGSHSVKAVYSGSTLFAASTSATKSVSIAKRATAISAEPALVKLLPLGLPLGNLKVKVSSTLGPLAGVPVQFSIGPNVVGTVNTDVNGVAQLNASSQILALVLRNGYDADFAGNANFLGSSAHGSILR